MAATTLVAPSSQAGRILPGVLATVTSADKQASGTFSVSPVLFGIESTIWLRASGPLDQDDSKKAVVLADLDGYRKATKVQAGYGGLYWNWNQDISKERSLCREAFANRPTPAIAKIIKAAIDKVAPTPANRDRVRDSVIAVLVTKQCARSNLSADDQQVFDVAVNYGEIWLWNLSGEYGRQDYQFADTVALKFKKETEHPKAGSLTVGTYLPTPRVLLSLTAKYQNGFDEGTPRQYCIPTGTMPAIQCRSVALSAPSTKNQMLIGSELRWFATASVGLSPRASVSANNDHTVAFELPILLRQAADEGFSTAVILGLRSKASSPDANDRSYFALQIGYTFGIGLDR
jgi:hypothetical protein